MKRGKWSVEIDYQLHFELLAHDAKTSDWEHRGAQFFSAADALRALIGSAGEGYDVDVRS